MGAEKRKFIRSCGWQSGSKEHGDELCVHGLPPEECGVCGAPEHGDELCVHGLPPEECGVCAALEDLEAGR